MNPHLRKVLLGLNLCLLIGALICTFALAWRSQRPEVIKSGLVSYTPQLKKVLCLATQ